VGFEVLDGLDFAVGGNQAADGAAFDCGGANLQRAGPGEDGDQSQSCDDYSDAKPGAAFGRGPSVGSVRVVIGCCQPGYLSSCGADYCKH
jgi:hypothetical protein